MPWTTPRTWVASQLVAAADLNVDIRDNLNYLYDRANVDDDGAAVTVTVSSTAWTPVSTYSVTLTTIGNPVLLIAPIGGAGVLPSQEQHYIRWYNVTNAQQAGEFYTTRAGSNARPPFSLIALETLPAGTYTWQVQHRVNTGSATGTIDDIFLYAIELL